MSLTIQVTKGLKWQAINIIGRQLLSFIIFATLARLLDPPSFGLFGLVNIYFSFVTLISEQGIGAAVIQKQDLSPSHLHAAFWINFCCATALCLITIAIAKPVALLFGDLRLVALLRCSALTLVITAISSIHATLFVKAMDFRQPTLRALIANAVGGIVGIGMAATGCGVWALVGQQIASAVAGCAFLWSMSSYRPRFEFSLRRARDLLGVSSTVFVNSILWFFASRVDQFVVGRVAGATTLGLYVVGSKIPELAKSITSVPLSSVTTPALAKLQHDHGRMIQAIRQGMELNAVVSFAVFVGIASVASDAVPLLLGPKWANASILTSLLSISALVLALEVFIHPALMASGGIGRYLFVNILCAVGSLVACVVGIRFGVIYLVLGQIVNLLICAVPALLFLRQRIGLSPLQYCKPCLVPLLSAATMWLAIHGIGATLPDSFPGVIRLVFKVLVGGLVYVGCLWVFARQSVDKLAHAARLALARRSHGSVNASPTASS